MKKPLTPIEGCTRCWCGAKYWDGLTCASCGEPFIERDYILDEYGTPQVTLDGISLVW